MAKASYALQHLDVQSASALLTGLYPTTSNGPAPLVTFGVQPNTNTVFLIGPEAAVERTRLILAEALEALVIEYDRDALERLGVDLTNISTRGQPPAIGRVWSPGRTWPR